MSPELEILEYLEAQDETLETLLLACPDAGRLVKCLVHMYDDGRICFRVEANDGLRSVREFEVQAWRRTAPDAAARARIWVGLTADALRRG